MKLSKENNTNTAERVSQYIDYLGVSINNFSKEIASNSYFNKLIKSKGSIGSDKIEKILRKYPELNPEWLLTGKGDMLKSTPYNRDIVNKSVPAYASKKTGVPYYKQFATAGNLPSFLESDIKGYINIPNVKVIGYLDVRGFSMKGVVENGDIIGVDHVEFKKINPSKPHLIVTLDQLMVKYVHYDESTPDHITCTSTNHAPFKVYIEDIKAIYFIRVITRFP